MHEPELCSKVQVLRTLQDVWWYITMFHRKAQRIQSINLREITTTNHTVLQNIGKQLKDSFEPQSTEQNLFPSESGRCRLHSGVYRGKSKSRTAVTFCQVFHLSIHLQVWPEITVAPSFGRKAVEYMVVRVPWNADCNFNLDTVDCYFQVFT